MLSDTPPAGRMASKSASLGACSMRGIWIAGGAAQPKGTKSRSDAAIQVNLDLKLSLITRTRSIVDEGRTTARIQGNATPRTPERRRSIGRYRHRIDSNYAQGSPAQWSSLAATGLDPLDCQ